MKMKDLKKWMICLTASLLAFSSCKETAGVDEPTLEANIVSFGFYAEDNQGIIDQDYVVATISENMTIEMPQEVSKSSLVARFTLSDGAKAYVDGAEQISSTTSNDYSVPVDFIINNGLINKKYTITIGKASNAVWTLLSGTPTQTFNDMVMVVNPTTGTPTLLGNKKTASSSDADYKMAVMFELKGENWQNIGPAVGFSTGQTANLALTFDGATPYVVFGDYTATISQQNTAMKFNGTEWTLLGVKGYTAGAQQYNTITVSKGTPYTFSMNNSKNIGVQRALVVSSFNGTAWSSAEGVIPRPGPTSTVIGDKIFGTGSYVAGAISLKDSIYVGVFNAGGVQSYSIYKYSPSENWVALVDFSLEAGAANSYMNSLKLDVDKNGNVYTLIMDDASGSFKARVKKYDSISKTWSQVGNLITCENNSSRQPRLALSPSGIPYVLYSDFTSKKLTVVSIDAETKDWTTPITLPTDATEMSNLNIDFSTSGVGYVAATASNVCQIFKLAPLK